MKIKRVLRYLLVIAIVIALFRIALFSFRFLLGTEFPLVVVEGRSMEPTFYEGDLLILKGVDDKRSISIQDVIVFFYEPYGEGKLIVHRVIEIIELSNDQIFFIAHGDANPIKVTERVNEQDVVGLYVSKVPPIIDSIVLFVESPTVTVFTVTVIIIVILVDIFYDKDKYSGSQEKPIYKGVLLI